MPLVSAHNINKTYGHLHVLKNVSLEVDTGEIVTIMGASGAGKSTLLHILGTLDKVDSGSLMMANTDILQLSDNKISAFRNKNIGFVFQFHYLLPEFTALENVCIPACIAGINRKIAQEKAMNLLKMMNLTERLHHKPSQLSGGEQQRVAIARALINNPILVLADEPSGNLDSNNACELHNLFLDLRKNLNQTFIIVTHNVELSKISDRILNMKDGKIDFQSVEHNNL